MITAATQRKQQGLTKPTRKQALELVRIEVATHGEVTKFATRLYIENRISREAFNGAVEVGQRQFNAAKK